MVVGLKQDRELAPEVVHAVEMHKKQILATHKVAVSIEETAMDTLCCSTYHDNFRQFVVLINMPTFCSSKFYYKTFHFQASYFGPRVK